MKDIGMEFLEKRQEIGVKKEEVMRDLNITMAQLDNLEDGNVNAFKDIFFLRELVEKYSKYLNLDEERIMKEFNNFVFNFTSRIPVEEIALRVKEISKEEQTKKIISPYTKTTVKKERKKQKIFFIIMSVILLAILLLLVIIIIKMF